MSLVLALFALKEEATWQWKKAIEEYPLDLVALQRSWDQVVREVMLLDQKKGRHENS